MAYLTTFYWGWLLASALLGFAMGWISVVQHGEGVSGKLRWVLSALVAALIGAALARVVPGRFGYWLDLGLIMFALYLCWLCGRIMVARLGSLAQCAAGLTAAWAGQLHRRHCHGLLTGPFYGPESPSGGGNAAKLRYRRHQLRLIC